MPICFFVFDKRQDDSSRSPPRSLSLITYRLQVMSDLISSELYPVVPLKASKGSDSGVPSEAPDGRWAS